MKINFIIYLISIVYIRMCFFFICGIVIYIIFLNSTNILIYQYTHFQYTVIFLV